LVTCLTSRQKCLTFAGAVALLILTCPAHPQTYQVGAGGQVKSKAANGQTQTQLGWGSNIQNARLARAAELALQRGDYPTAENYAQRAARSAPDDPQLWFLLGYVARLNHNYALSATAFQHGLRLKPSSVQGISGLAQTYSDMGRVAEAEKLLKQALAVNPRQVDDLLVLGNLYLQGGDYPDAVTYLRRAEQVKPNARSELLLAICYERQKQMDMASRYLHLAQRRAPNNPDVERSLAGYYRETGNYRKAIDQLRAIRNPPPDVVGELAYTYQLDGKPQDAARLYSRAADAMPRNPGMQLSAAQAEVTAQSPGRADPFLTRAAAINPNYYRLHQIRAEIAELGDHNTTAVKEYQAAIASLPPTPVEGPLYGIQLHMDLQTLYRQLDQDDAAQQQLQIAQQQINSVQVQPGERPAFLRLRAQIEMNTGQLQPALNDMQAALALTPNDPNSLQIDGDVLMKMGRTRDAIAVYRKVLGIDPRSRLALTSLGYAARTEHNDRDAEKYFNRLAADYPGLYIPYLALGDLYTDRGRYKKAELYYDKAYTRDRKNALIVADAMNAAIEEHNLPLAATWLNRVTPGMYNSPQILAQKERYFRFQGNYRESAENGEKAIQSLPRDRDVVVYLGYDLLNLGKYDELLALTKKYDSILTHEPDIPLLEGYVYKEKGDRKRAVQAFTEAIQRGPTVETAYVNRGFVENDLREPAPAQKDFTRAIHLEPKDGQAHLGLAYSDLALNDSPGALRQSKLAQAYLGDSEAVHIIRATAYGREGMLSNAIVEYRAALHFNPHDGTLYMDMGNLYFAQRRFDQAIAELKTAGKYLPNDAQIFAMLARSYAGVPDRRQAMANVEMAEKLADHPPSEGATWVASDIYVDTGEALSALGDNKAAMQRFARALVEPRANRVGVRLAIAQLMAQQGHDAGAERQIALAQMEAEAGVTDPPTGPQYLQAAGILQQMHEYRLSQTYLERALAAGASDLDVRVDLANSYLALGETQRAAGELAAVSQADVAKSDYSYLLAQANVYQQEHQGTAALSEFAQAASAAGEDPTAEQDLMQVGANEGYRINKHISVLSNLLQQPIYEDSTVYELDSKTFGNPPAIYGGTVATSKLPLPRYTIDTEWTDAFHLHLHRWPTTGGFFQIRNARGMISMPAIGIVRRSTWDYNFNYGVAPDFRLGSTMLSFNAGFMGTIRRDTISPREMDQNIGRLFAYMSTGSFWDAVSVNASVVHDFGPFTEIPLHESTLAGTVDFRVGAPWAKTALVTGWGSNDQIFTSGSLGNTENYFTTSYIGLTHRFSPHLNIEGIAEDWRAWRVVPFVVTPGTFIVHSGIAQAIRPAGTVNYSPARNWQIQFSTAYENTRSFHVYDMTQNGFSLSYTRPFGRSMDEDTGTVHVRYPIRFSAGVQEETFPNYTGIGRNQEFRPYVSINLF
jgi:tetratricopeptide (TPR) repeat protein